MKAAELPRAHWRMCGIALLLVVLDGALIAARALPMYRQKLGACHRSVSRAVQRLGAVGLTCAVNGSAG